MGKLAAEYIVCKWILIVSRVLGCVNRSPTGHGFVIIRSLMIG